MAATRIDIDRRNCVSQRQYFGGGHSNQTRTCGVGKLAVWTSLVIAASLIALTPLGAATRELTEAELANQAELIVRGRVLVIHASNETPAWVADDNDISFFARRNFIDTNYTITIDVSAVEKGHSPAPDKTIVIHAWRIVKRPSGFVGPTGTIRQQPRVGEHVKVYLKRAPEGWETFSASGFSTDTDTP